MARIDEAVTHEEDLEEVLKKLDEAEEELFSDDLKSAFQDAFSEDDPFEEATEQLPPGFAMLIGLEDVQPIEVVDIESSIPDPDSVPKPFPASPSTADALGDLLASLPPAQRVNILKRFCAGCGADRKLGARCQCQLHRTA